MLATVSAHRSKVKSLGEGNELSEKHFRNWRNWLSALQILSLLRFAEEFFRRATELTLLAEFTGQLPPHKTSPRGTEAGQHNHQ